MADTMTSSAMRTDFSRDLDAVKKDLANLKNDFAGMANHLGVHAKDRAAAAADSMQDVVKSSLSSAETCVKERPLSSVLIAFGAGVLVAKLLNR